jgi:hypothetical protein
MVVVGFFGQGFFIPNKILSDDVITYSIREFPSCLVRFRQFAFALRFFSFLFFTYT